MLLLSHTLFSGYLIKRVEGVNEHRGLAWSYCFIAQTVLFCTLFQICVSANAQVCFLLLQVAAPTANNYLFITCCVI